MGIYEILAGQSQILKLSMVHQDTGNSNQKDYINELQEFTNQVLQESENKEKAFSARIEETIAKSVQSLKGNLSEFLSTPIRSDLGEIQNLIFEHAKQLEKQIVIPSKINVYDALLSKYSSEEINDLTLRPLALSARRLLKSRGFSNISDHQTLYASDFIISGVDTLTVLESIFFNLLSSRFKDLFTHATHSIQIYDLFSPAGYRREPAEKYEILLTIRNREFEPSIVMDKLGSWFDKLGTGPLTRYLWKKSLFSGFDSETVLEIHLKDKAEIKHLLLLISGHLGLFKKMFPMKEASLIVKERIVL